MALPGDATDLTSFTELVPSEFINSRILAPNLAPATGLSLAWPIVVPPGQGSSVAIPTYDTISPTAGNKTEADAMVILEMLASERTVSAGMVANACFISNELQHDQIVRDMESQAGNLVRAILNRIDTDILSKIADATNTAAHGDVALTNSLLIDDMATFMGLNPNLTDRLALVLSHVQWRDWKKSVDNSTAANFGNDARSEMLRTLYGPKAGFRGVWEDMEVFVTPNVLSAGGVDSGALTTAGEGGALVYASWQPLQVTTDYIHLNTGWQFHVSVRYGVGVSKMANLLEIQSSDD